MTHSIHPVLQALCPHGRDGRGPQPSEEQIHEFIYAAINVHAHVYFNLYMCSSFDVVSLVLIGRDIVVQCICCSMYSSKAVEITPPTIPPFNGTLRPS